MPRRNYLPKYSESDGSRAVRNRWRLRLNRQKSIGSSIVHSAPSVYVNDSLTIDFVDPGLFGAEGVRVEIHHYCFRVSDAGFDAILERVKHIGLKYWSDQQLGEPDYKINTRLGGRGFYFTEPDGHSWEILTVSYARPAN
jgi:catechol 2,3-dioxygenase-like lactoylglutathione lyase family enzyme